MGANFSISEILLVAVVVLIVFGPHRLPEMARKAGEMMAKIRKATEAIRSELSNEYSDLAEPLSDIERDLRAAKQDIQATLPHLDDDVMGPPKPKRLSDGESSDSPAGGDEGGRPVDDEAGTDAGDAQGDASPAPGVGDPGSGDVPSKPPDDETGS